MKATHIALAVLGGALAGAAAALLLAPQKGEKTRHDIRKFIADKRPDLSKERLESLVDQIHNAIKH